MASTDRPFATDRAHLSVRVSSSALPTVAITGLLAVTFLAHQRFVWAGFAGSDSLTLIDTRRFARVQDAVLQFTRPVMAGTQFAEREVVYRPFVSLTFGLEYAIWSLDAAGYHLTNLGLHLAATLSVWWLLRLLGLRWWSSVAGAAVLALHPLVVATVPVIARRDSIAPVLAFTVGAGLLLIAQRACGFRRNTAYFGSLLAITIALLSKESAFAALAMVPVLLTCASVGNGRQLRCAISRSIGPSVALLAIGVVVFAVRFAVLGGLGGVHNPHLVEVSIEKYVQILGAYTRYLVWAFAWTAPSPAEIWPRVGGEILCGLGITLVWVPRRQALLAAAGTLWVVGFGTFCALLQIGTIAFVAYFALVGLGLVFAASLEGSIARLRWPLRPGTVLAPRSRAASVVLLTGLSVAAFSWFWTSALVRDYYQWQLAGTINAQFLQSLETCVRGAPLATHVRLHALPEDLDDGTEDTRLMSVTLLQDYTVQSALRLAFPDRPLTVAAVSSQTLRSAEDTLRFSCTDAGDGVEFTTMYASG